MPFFSFKRSIKKQEDKNLVKKASSNKIHPETMIEIDEDLSGIDGASTECIDQETQVDFLNHIKTEQFLRQKLMLVSLTRLMVKLLSTASKNFVINNAGKVYRILMRVLDQIL